MKIAFYGYGKLGAAVERMAPLYPDTELLFGVTRRPPESVKRPADSALPLISASSFSHRISELDCLLMTASSDADLPELVPHFAGQICLVDPFDRHGRIPEHLRAVDSAAKKSRHTAVLCSGWDPGLFSAFRIYAAALFPYAKTSTFWGRGISEGHSSAVMHIKGVKNALSFTVPLPDARIFAGHGVMLPAEKRHRREVYVLPHPGADPSRITEEIQTMPDYFSGYETDVHFLNESEFSSLEKEPSHQGEVLTVGKSGRFSEHGASLSFQVRMDSNPEFTAGILLASARAAVRLQREKRYGVFTFADIPPACFLPSSILKENLL